MSNKCFIDPLSVLSEVARQFTESLDIQEDSFTQAMEEKQRHASLAKAVVNLHDKVAESARACR